MKHTLTFALIGAALALAGCTEKPQTVGAKTDSQPWNTQATGFTAPGFKAGEADAWQTQMRRRAAAQNEYARSSTGS